MGYNGIDGKEVTMSKFKEDINQTIILYLIIRAIKNGILYFIPREECYIEDDNKFIQTYDELKEMVIEEQSKLSFNKKI